MATRSRSNTATSFNGGNAISEQSSACKDTLAVAQNSPGKTNIILSTPSPLTTDIVKFKTDQTKVWLDGDTIKPIDVPRSTTYAEATNLALRYPQYASQILALPMGRASSPERNNSPNENHSTPKRGTPSRSRSNAGKGSAKKQRAPRRPMTRRRSSSDTKAEDSSTDKDALAVGDPPSPTYGINGSKVAHTSASPNWALAPESPEASPSRPVATTSSAVKMVKMIDDKPPPAPPTVPPTAKTPPTVSVDVEPRHVHPTSNIPMPSPTISPISPTDSVKSNHFNFSTAPLDLKVYPQQCAQPLFAAQISPAIVAPQPSEVDALVAALQAARIKKGALSSTEATLAATGSQKLGTSTQWVSRGKASSRAEIGSQASVRDGVPAKWGRGKSSQRANSRNLMGPPPFLPAGLQALSGQQMNSGLSSGNRAPSPDMPARQTSPFDMGSKLHRPDSAHAMISQHEVNAERWVTLDEICAMYPVDATAATTSPQPGYPRAPRARGKSGGWGQDM